MTRPCLIGIAFALLALPSAARAQNLVSPVHGYLSVEPFELRKEFVFRFETIAERLGRGEVTEIGPSNRAAIEKQIGEWLTGKCPVEADGRKLSFELDRVHFVRPDPEMGLIVDDRETFSTTGALVGVVFATAWDAPPGSLKIVWEIFPADGSEAVVEAGSRDSRSARKLTPKKPELIWKNEGIEMPELLAVPEIEVRSRRGFSRGIWWALLVVAGLLWLVFRGKMDKHARRFDFLMAVLVVGLFFFLAKAHGFNFRAPKVEPVTAEGADEICFALLRNIYHSFDFRSESDVYDTLAESTTGDLLKQIYLEIQRSLQLESQGGARVRVYDVDLRNCELGGGSSRSGEFSANCEWVAVGTVTHWGHTHDRVNKYRARMTVAPVDERWRLVGLALESEERIQQKVR